MTHTMDQERAAVPETAHWSAVGALSLCVATLIVSEFMPVSLLTPIAADLDLSEGQAGQAIAISGLFAVITSLFIAAATPRLDRRALLLGLTLLMLVSGLVVAFALNYLVLLVGRALVGVVIGGFWSMSAATVMRLVPPADVPRGLAILNGGNALATTIAAPLGSFLGQYIGWRGSFFGVVPLAAITFVWLHVTLPSMPSEVKASALATLRVLRRPHMSAGMFAVALLFMGQFVLFTYLRPFLETVTRVDISTLSSLLLLLGVAGLIGTLVVDRVLRRGLRLSLIAMPLIMALAAVGFAAFGGSLPITAGLLALWGLVGTAAPVAWWSWLARTLPREAEAGGGLMVAVIQLAITMGASFGGLLFDTAGYQVTFWASAALLVACSIVASRSKTNP